MAWCPTNAVFVRWIGPSLWKMAISRTICDSQRLTARLVATIRQTPVSDFECKRLLTAV
jgi:hypothetical protein